MTDFIVLDSNRAAWRAVGDWASPNPDNRLLCLYGPPSAGKTHLARAALRATSERSPGAAVDYSTIESFISEYIEALCSGSEEDFLGERFMRLGALVLENIELVSGKQATISALRRILAGLLEHGGRALLTVTTYHPIEHGCFSEMTYGLKRKVARISAPGPGEIRYLAKFWSRRPGYRRLGRSDAVAACDTIPALRALFARERLERRLAR